MRISHEQFLRSCECRSVGECNHNDFVSVHALEALVDAFAEQMKAKLRQSFLRGKHGWDDQDWPVEDIQTQLAAHLAKGDPVDVANFAAFWWNRTDEWSPEALYALGGAAPREPNES